MNKFLFAAFSLVWLLFFIYVWVLSRRQSKLDQELADLKHKLRRE